MYTPHRPGMFPIQLPKKRLAPNSLPIRISSLEIVMINTLFVTKQSTNPNQIILHQGKEKKKNAKQAKCTLYNATQIKSMHSIRPTKFGSDQQKPPSR